MSLRNGLEKMSKSEESDYSRISLTDNDESIRKKITPLIDENKLLILLFLSDIFS